MAAAESISQGMILKLKQTSAGALAALGDIVSLSGPGSSRTVIQIGATDSVNSTNIQKAGRVTRGAWNFTVNFDPADAALATSLKSGAAYAHMQLESAGVNDSTHASSYWSWQITFDDGTTADFDGFISNFTIDAADDGVVTASFAVTLQTDVTFA